MPYTTFVRGSLLMVGLTLYGLSDAMLVLSGLGLDPWDVLHQGLSRSIGGQVGTWTDIVGVVVLLGWVPLRQKPGIGTVTNVIVIGIVVNICLDVLPGPHGVAAQSAVMLSAVVLNAVATGLYIGAGLGPGPRDGLMTGIAARGRSVRVVRTGIEVSVLAIGWLLGGTVGIGTVVYALAIGPLVHLTLPLLALSPRPLPAGLPEPSVLPGSGGSSPVAHCPTRSASR